MGCVYLVTCTRSKKVYVGVTKFTPERRLARHLLWARKGYQSKFAKAIRRFGEENFKTRAIFESDDMNLLYEKEKFWIAVHKKIGGVWNMTPGGKTWMPNKKYKAYKRKKARETKAAQKISKSAKKPNST